MSPSVLQAEIGRRPRGAAPAAFTLVELLVVIGIIALLIGVLVPTLAASRSQAEMTKCKANLRSIHQALVMYANENRDRFPGNKFTLGTHPFRAAVGRTMPGRSVLPESYGLPALLHGVSPGSQPVLPLTKPRYISGESNVWICPSAPERLSKWGNTYAWTSASVDTLSSLQRHKMTINASAYAHTDTRTTYLWDNSTFGPGLTGYNGPFSGTSGADPYRFPGKVFPHANYKKGYQGAINNLALNGEIVTQFVKE